MHALIVYAHQEPKSFNGAMRDLAVSVLEDQGYTVEVSDLYATNFQATAGREDFHETANADFFKYQPEQIHAGKTGGFADDISAELEKFRRADLLILQFPLWWFGLPAILKGWVDRVFAAGIIYDRGHRYSNGHFQGKRAMLSFTVGGSSDSYTPDGMHGDMDVVLWPIQNGILNYVGFSVLPPYIAYGADRVEAAEREGLLRAYEERLRTLETTEPLFFHRFEDFGEDLRLKPGITRRTTGQHRAD